MRASMVLLVVLGVMVASTHATFIPKENTFYRLDCPGNGDMAYFLLHGEKDAYPVDFTDSELTVFSNGSIIFKSVQVHHEGTHLCMRRHSDDMLYGHPVSLRVRPLPPADLWGDVYQSQFITGLIAAITIAAIFVLGCLVYKYRWRPVGKDMDNQPIVSSEGYDNPVMIGSGDIEASSTKM